jgi:multidrug resistance efflux pump
MATSRTGFWLRLACLGLALGAAVLVGVFVVWPWLAGNVLGADGEESAGGEGARKGPEDQASGALPVQVVAPKLDPNLTVSVSQPAYVAPYYQVELRARAAGPVVFVRKAINDKVAAGETLIRISVPDLDQEVAKKTVAVKQREQELEVARAMKKKAEADIQIARSVIKEKESDVRVADATTEFRRQELERFRGMARDKVVLGNIVAERQKFFEAAEAASATARAAVERAKADELAAKAKLQQAIADEDLKETLIGVAREDLNLAKALQKFANVEAPFDGVITRRNVDLGTFVQNSTNSPGQPLMTIEKTDIVTIYMNLPDNYAPYIDEKTEAVIEMSELPSVQIRARVTRYSPSLQTPGNDRTMRVEVDLFNRGAIAWKQFLEKEKKTGYADLKGGKLPYFPDESRQLAKRLGIRRLLPGMYGKMKLVLKKFEGAYLIPSQAVFSTGGKSYLYLVRDNVAKRVPVEVQVDDGVLAKVVITERVGRVEERRELTGKERVVLSNQGELSNGQRVTANEVRW